MFCLADTLKRYFVYYLSKKSRKSARWRRRNDGWSAYLLKKWLNLKSNSYWWICLLCSSFCCICCFFFKCQNVTFKAHPLFLTCFTWHVFPFQQVNIHNASLSLCAFQLLDCFVIPVLMVLSWFFLKTRYRLVHFVAVVVCLLGVGAMVGADILAGRDQGSSKDTFSSFIPVKYWNLINGNIKSRNFIPQNDHSVCGGWWECCFGTKALIVLQLNVRMFPILHHGSDRISNLLSSA